MLHTGKSISHSYPPVTCPGSSLDLSSFNLQPLKFIYTLFLRLKTYPACCCYLQAVTGSSLNLPLDKKKKKKNFLILFNPSQVNLMIIFWALCDLMNNCGQVDLVQTQYSVADFFGIVGWAPTTSLLLPEHYLAIAFIPLTVGRVLPTTTPTQFTKESKASSGF